MRQKLLCSFLLLLGSQVALGQQWPNYREPAPGNQGANWTAAGYGAPGHYPMPGTPGDTAPGAIGQPGTIPLFGQNGLDYGMNSGVRLEAGIWLDKDNRYSADVSGFTLLQRTLSFSAASDATGNPVLVRPIFDAV